VLLLEVTDYRDSCCWDWRLATLESGEFHADHQVRLDAESLQYQALTDLHAAVRRSADPTRPLQEELELLERIGEWIGDHLLASIVQ
jgi:hypothetical protein